MIVTCLFVEELEELECALGLTAEGVKSICWTFEQEGILCWAVLCKALSVGGSVWRGRPLATEEAVCCVAM